VWVFPERLGVLAGLDAVAFLPGSETISVFGEEPHDADAGERALEDVPRPGPLIAAEPK
jgi:hypothetical protein